MAKPAGPLPARAEHRVGGGVEVLVFTHLENQGDFDDIDAAAKARLLPALAPGMASECPKSEKVQIARVWEVATGAFSRVGVAEKLILVRIDRCGVPGGESWLLGLVDAAGRVAFRLELPGETTLARAPDPFAEGRRYLVLATRTGAGPAKRVTAKIARIEGGQLAIVAESEPMDPGCRTGASAAWFYGVLRPGRPPEFRTAKAAARCDDR